MLEKYKISKETEGFEKKVSDRLHEDGIAVVENYLDPSVRASLIEEYKILLKLDEKAVRKMQYPQGEGVCAVKSLLSKERFPVTSAVFSSDSMQKIADTFLGKPNYLNREIYIAKDVHEEFNPLNQLHYDKLFTLKFFIYLNDVDVSNGAFECAPGSHKLANKIIDFHLRRGRKIRDLPNRIIPDHVSKSVPIEAGAGAMIIFRTDVYHRAGSLEKGKERWVMRGHSRPHPQPVFHPSRYSAQWFRESGLNVNRYLYKVIDAISPKDPPEVRYNT